MSQNAIFLLLFSLLLLLLCSSSLSSADTNVIEMDKKRSISLLLHQHKPSFLLFLGPSDVCPSCTDLRNEFLIFANRTRGLAKIGFLDAVRFRQIARGGYGIKKLPTIFFWKKGNKSGKKPLDYLQDYRNRELARSGEAVDADELEEFTHEQLILKENTDDADVAALAAFCPKVQTVEEVKKLVKAKSSSSSGKVVLMFSSTERERKKEESGEKGETGNEKETIIMKEENEQGEEDDDKEEDDDENETRSVTGSLLEPELLLFSSFKLISISIYFRHRIAFGYSIDNNLQLLNQLCPQTSPSSSSSSSSQTTTTKQSNSDKKKKNVIFRLISLDSKTDKFHCDFPENDANLFNDPISASPNQDAGSFYFPLLEAITPHARVPLPDPNDSTNPMSTSRTVPVQECTSLRECFANHAEKPFVVRNTPELRHFTRDKLLKHFMTITNITVLGFTQEAASVDRTIASLAHSYANSINYNNNNSNNSDKLDVNVFNGAIESLFEMNGAEKELKLPKEFDEFEHEDAYSKTRTKTHTPVFSPAGGHTGLHADTGSDEYPAVNGFMHIVDGEKHWRYIDVEDYPKFYHTKKEEATDKMDQIKRHNKIIEEQNVTVYAMTMYAGDSMVFPPGWLHEIWTTKPSLGFVNSFLLKGSLEVQKVAKRVDDPARGL